MTNLNAQTPTISTEQKRQKASSQLVVRAAFFLAVVSCFTTALGIKDFVFSNDSGALAYIMSGLISFAIQTILFVLNLNVIGFFLRLVEKSKAKISAGKDAKLFPRIWKGFLRSLIYIVFLASSFAILGASSWFSFVHFSYETHAGTKISLSTRAINDSLVDALNLAEGKSNEYKDSLLTEINGGIGALELDMGEEDSADTKFIYGLQVDFARPQTWKNIIGVDNIYEKVDDGKTVTELVDSDGSAENVENKIREYVLRCGENLNDISEYQELLRCFSDYDGFVTAKNTAEETYSKDYNSERTKDKGDRSKVTGAQEDVDEAYKTVEQAFNDFTSKLRSLEPLTKASLASNLLSESLKPVPNIETMSKNLNSMIDLALQGAVTDTNFERFVKQMQAISVNTDRYRRLIEIQMGDDGIDKLRQEINDEPDAALDEAQWRTEYREKLNTAKTILRTTSYLPPTSSDEDNPRQVDLEIEEQIGKIDDVMHRYTDDLNTMEYVWIMLLDHDFLSVFSLLLALMIDLIAVFAGMFSKLAMQNKKPVAGATVEPQTESEPVPA